MHTGTLDPASRRGDWRWSLSLYSPSGMSDPGAAVYRVDVRCLGPGGGWLDYGRWMDGDHRSLLSASSADGTARLAVTPTPTGLAISALFPRSEMSRLYRGAHEASVLATLGAETSEIARLSFVVI